MITTMLRFKRQILVACLSLAVIFLSVYAWNYLRYGTITVTTDNPDNTITISEVKEGENDETLFEKSATGELFVRVSPGTYVIRVESKSFAINKTVVVEARKSIKQNLNPPETTSIEPVASVAGGSLYANGEFLNFIDPKAGFLYQITKENQIKPLSDTLKFQQVEWSESGEGAAKDNKGNLYKIDGNIINRLALPPPLEEPGEFSFELSPKGDLYVSSKNGIYFAKGTTQLSRVRSEAPEATPALAASNEMLAIIVPPPNDSIDGEQKESFVEVIDAAGNSLAKKNIAAMNGAWSPDGSKLILTDYYGSSGIYSSGLELLKILPGDHIRQAVWLDNERFVYAAENSIWLYSVREEQSQTLTSLSLGNVVSSLAFSQEGEYIYISASNSEKSVIYRFSLAGRGVSEDISKLAVFLPVGLDDCRLNYVNFAGKPSIVMQAAPGNESLCRAQADIELVQDGISADVFDFQFSPAPE